MGRSLDIANLFHAFGGDPHRYREFELPESMPGSLPPPTPNQAGELPALVAPDVGRASAPAISTGSSGQSLEQSGAYVAEHAVVALNQALSRAQLSLSASVLAIMSAKGGTGKTVVAAGLAQRLAERGQKVLLVELDAQNVLTALLQPQMNAAMEAVPLPLASCLPVTEQLRMLPFGNLSERDLQALEHSLQVDTHWLAQRLATLDVSADTWVILDCPTGSTPIGRQALAMATQVLGVTTADTAGHASIARLDHQLQRYAAHAHCTYLLNRVDPARPLTTDIATLVARSCGNRLLGILPESTALEQALAAGQGLFGLQDDWTNALDELAETLLADTAALELRHERPLP